MIWFAILSLTQADELHLQIPSDNIASISLNDYIIGNNLTYNVTGSYTDSTGSPINITMPIISQGMEPKWSTNKPPNYGNSFILDPQFLSIAYTAEGVNLVTWGLNNFPEVQQISSLTMSQYIRGLFPFVHSSTVTALLLVNYTYPNLTFYVAKSIEGTLTPLLELNQTFTTCQSVPTIDFELRNTTVYAYISCFDGASTYLNVYSMPTSLTKTIQFVRSITAQELGREISPVKFVGQGEIGFFCDMYGVFILSMSSISSQPPAILSIFGNWTGFTIYDCIISNSLILSTSQGVFNYTIQDYKNSFLSMPAFVLAANQPISQYYTNTTTGGTFMQYSPQGEVVALYESYPGPISKVKNFKVLNNVASNIGQSIVIDIQTSSFLIDWAYDNFPAFLLYYFKFNLYVIFDTYSQLRVYRIHRSPTLTFTPNVTGAYTFTGVISTETAGTYNITVTALDIHNTAEVYVRDPAPPSLITHSLGVSDSVYTDIYFPVSNYLFGPNLTFMINAFDSNMTNRSVEIPPIAGVNQTLTYQFPVSTPHIKVLNEAVNYMAVNTYQNTVELFSCMNSQLNTSRLSSLRPDNDTNTISDFTFVYSLMDNTTGIILASYTPAGYLTFDLFDIADPLTPICISSVSTNYSSLQKFEGFNTLAYALIPHAILVFNYTLLEGLDQVDVITAERLMRPQFIPIDIASNMKAESNLFILDECLGLILLDVTTMRYQSVYSNKMVTSIIAPIANDWYQEVYVIGKELIRFSKNETNSLEITGEFPSSQLCTYSNATYSVNYMALICMNSTSIQLYVIDTTTLMPDSLVTAIPIATNGSIALANVQPGVYHLYFYDGSTIIRFQIGQFVTSWNPVSDLFSTPAGTTIWARVTLYFALPPNETEYIVPLNLTASCWDCESQSINVTYSVQNPGTFILSNPSSNSLFASSSPKPYFNVSGAAISDDMFFGLDMTYSVMVNNYEVNTMSNAVCESNLVCISPKTTLESNYNPLLTEVELTTFTSTTNGMMYFAYRNELYSVGRDMMEVKMQRNFSISQELGFNETSCFLLTAIQNNLSPNLIAAACIGIHPNGASASFVALVDTSESDPIITIQEVSYVIESLSAIQLLNQNSSLFFFVSDGYEVNVYLFQDSQPIGLYTKITAASMQLNWLSPNSVIMGNDGTFILGDANNGPIHLVLVQSVKQFSPGDVLSLPIGDTAVVAVRIKQQTMAILTQQGFFTLYSLKNGYTYEKTFSPVEVPEFVPFLDVLATDSEMEYLAYFVVISGTYNIRVINTFADSSSGAYTTIDTGCPVNSTVRGSLEIIETGGDSFQIAALLPGVLNYTLYSVNPKTSITVNQPNSESARNNFTMQVIAKNAMSKATGPSFTVYFTNNDTNETGHIVELESFKHVYQLWWFWASIGFGLIISFTAISLLFIKYYGRHKPRRSLSIAMTETNRSMDRFSSLSVS